MNSQEYRNLQEAYLQVYSVSTLNEFGPGDAGGSLAVKRTFGGAPGTKQNTTVSGSASVGGSNVSGSLEKGTFSGQGDKTSQGVDNALKDYDDQVKNGKPNVTPRPTGTSTITTGVRGTLDANVSGRMGPGSNTQSNIKKDMQKREMLKTAATNIQNQQKAKAAADAASSASTSSALKSTPDDGRALRPDDGETPNEKKPENTTTARSRLSTAGITPGDATSRKFLDNKSQTSDGARARSLEKDLNDVEGEDNKARIAQSVNPRRMERIAGTDRYGVGSLIKQSFDFFDTVRDYLLDEGYADTNENALVIMANMSEEWRESIIEQQTDSVKDQAKLADLRNTAFGSKKFQQVVDDSPSNPRSKNFNPNSLKTPGV